MGKGGAAPGEIWVALKLVKKSKLQPVSTMLRKIASCQNKILPGQTIDEKSGLEVKMIENVMYYNRLERSYKMGIVGKVIVFTFGTVVLKVG
ncbi:hypothetical protein [Microbulbifer sp. VVAC002]|uniref:hypothetical protein n=1 Tax=Microbulbifer sp. VVAC002 TaxID=3243387 RepID=UPI00403A48AA